MSETAPLIFLRRMDRAPSYGTGWQSDMLAYLLTPLATDERRGSVFGEYSDPVDIFVTVDRERMLAKSAPVVRRGVVAPLARNDTATPPIGRGSVDGDAVGHPELGHPVEDAAAESGFEALSGQ